MRASDRRSTVGVGPAERLLALIGLIITSPITAVASLVIKASSPGPVLYRAVRVGRGGGEFTMYKLRTMHDSADRAGVISARDDPRVFTAGAIIRRCKIDELPQLVNVVRGEMSFIGPRPEAPHIVAKHYRKWMLETLTVPPGIVGPGSLSYFLDEASLPDDPREAELVYVSEMLSHKLARDLVFVRRQTTRHRCQIALRALLGIFGVRNVGEAMRRRETAAASAILAEHRSNDFD